MTIIPNSGMARGLKEFFKDYKGCRNCKHQPDVFQMCEWGKRRQIVELICSGWEKRKLPEEHTGVENE